ncbi:MAG: carbohydrate binding family 9 domain-containing protein, partial [Gemmatimonadetes bacterium]|nr:carbohydrate binding family 9 domain-containing protein [Gemmatimonadota bacterium]
MIAEHRTLEVRTRGNDHVVDLTSRLQAAIADTGVRTGQSEGRPRRGGSPPAVAPSRAPGTVVSFRPLGTRFRHFRPAMLRSSVSLALLASLAAGPSCVSAQQGPPPGHGNGPRARVSAAPARAAEPPVVDGRLDDEAWSAASPISGFVQREPAEGNPVSERTEVRLLVDDQALYVGAWLYDSDPEGIVLGERIRDADLERGDYFGIILDTYRDRQNGFIFTTNPAGIEYDAQVVKEGEGGG